MECVLNMNGRALGMLLVIGLLAAAGCDQKSELVPVTGQVLIDGKPLTYGAIRLVPSTGRPAYSQLDAEGRFKLVTDEEEGCVEGTHAVEIGAVEPLSETENRIHAPETYGSAATSGLTATISGPTDDLIVNLTWGGRKPPK